MQKIKINAEFLPRSGIELRDYSWNKYSRDLIDGVFMCTLMAGVMLVILGATGLGTAVRFIPRPVVIGFTNGIALLIASTQIKDFFGLHLARVPSEFWLRIKALASAFPTLSPTATILAVSTVATMLLCRAISTRIPG